MKIQRYLSGLVIIYFLLTTNTGKTQDPYYSQYYNTPLLYNPAMVGLVDGLKARLMYRNQWPQYNDDLKSYNFSMDVAERHMPGSGGLGFIFNTNKEGNGFIQKNTVGALGSVRVRMTRNIISQFGFMAAYVQKQIDSEDFIWSDQLDDRHGLLYPHSSFPGFNTQKVTYPDISLGGIVNYENHYRSLTVGLAVHHILKPNESFYNLDTRVARKYVAHADMVIFQQSNAKKGFKFSPGILFENQAGFNTFTLGMNVAKSVLFGGMWYRNKQSQIYDYQALALVTGINIPMVNQYSRMKLMYSYDISITQMKGAGGSHEITLRFEFDQIHFVKSRSAFANDYPIIFDPVVF
jgi:type IX secretion system PorP/SprF family membrane protein